MDIDYLQKRLNRLRKQKAEVKKQMDAAYNLYNREPTEEHLIDFENLRKRHCVLGDSVSRAKNKLERCAR